MDDEREQAVTDEVIASFSATKDERVKQVVESLTRHLHAFAREVRLTEAEWAAGIDFLTRTGHITDERRQEFVLLSDVLGLSMLTVGINAPASPLATESTVFGPFFAEGSPRVELGGDISFGAKGVPCWVSGTVHDTEGAPVGGARMEMWETDEDGLYDAQYPDGRTQARGWLHADSDGGYRFWSLRPVAYPIPADGPVGELLAATGRGPMRPAHLHFRVTAPGHRTLITHIFAAGDEYLRRDAVFGVKDSLVVDFAPQLPGTAPDGRELHDPWALVHFDFILEKQ